MKEYHAVRSSRREFMGGVGLAATAGLLSMPLAESAESSWETPSDVDVLPTLSSRSRLAK